MGLYRQLFYTRNINVRVAFLRTTLSTNNKVFFLRKVPFCGCRHLIFLGFGFISKAVGSFEGCKCFEGCRFGFRGFRFRSGTTGFV